MERKRPKPNGCQGRESDRLTLVYKAHQSGESLLPGDPDEPTVSLSWAHNLSINPCILKCLHDDLFRLYWLCAAADRGLFHGVSVLPGADRRGAASAGRLSLP